MNWDAFSCKISQLKVLSLVSAWNGGGRWVLVVYKLAMLIEMNITFFGNFVFFCKVDETCCIFEIWPLFLCNQLKNFIYVIGQLFCSLSVLTKQGNFIVLFVKIWWAGRDGFLTLVCIILCWRIIILVIYRGKRKTETKVVLNIILIKINFQPWHIPCKCEN